MTKKIKALLVLLVLVLAAAGASAYAYQAERTPEYALEQLGVALTKRDGEALARYVNVDSVVTQAYDESTQLLAQDIAHLHQLYPQDWFFRHDTAFMKDYIAGRRGDDLVFIHRCLEFCGDENLMPIGLRDGQAKWLSDEAVKFRDNYTVRIDDIRTQDKTAEAVLVFTGKDTDYGRLVPELTAKVELTQQNDGHWQIQRFTNVSDMFYPFVKGIEDYWTLQGWQ